MIALVKSYFFLFNNILLMTTQLQIKQKRKQKDRSANRGSPQVRGQRDMWYQQDQSWNQPVGSGRGPLVQTRPTKVRSSVWGNNGAGQEWSNTQKVSQQYQLLEDNISAVAKFIDNQVVLMEPSPVQKKVGESKKMGKKFVDERFPPNNNSLCGEVGSVNGWKWIEWVNISDKIPGEKIFAGKIQPQDIKQGKLGDCYFLAGLAALAERPDRIKNLFLVQQTNDTCSYQVKMLYKGKWMVIDMDEKIPWLDGQPAFSKSVDGQLWVILLEKAWAKMYSSYRRTEAGYNEEPLHDLTGAPIRQLMIRKGNYDKREEWEYLLEASRLQYSMVCSSNTGKDTQKSQSGVVLGHAYTLLKVDTINFNGVQHKVVQLRNPWGGGQSEFTGQWSDKDKNWSKISVQEKERLGYFDIDDGIFFIPFDQFWKEFQSITIAEINDDASYVYKSCKDKNQQGVYFRVDIKKEGNYSLQIDKTPERAFQENLQKFYRYPHTIVELGLINSRNIERLKGFADKRRTTEKKYRLSPGVYIVKVLMDFDPKFEKDFDVNLAVYADYPCIVELANNQQACLLEGRRVNWTGQETKETESWNNLAAYGYKQEVVSAEREGFAINNSNNYNNSNNGNNSSYNNNGNNSNNGNTSNNGNNSSYNNNANSSYNNNGNYNSSYNNNGNNNSYNNNGNNSSYNNNGNNSSYNNEYKPQSISFEQLWLKTSAMKDNADKDQSSKVKGAADNRPRTSSTVMQLLKQREEVASLFERQDQKEQKSSSAFSNQKTQFGRWQL